MTLRYKNVGFFILKHSFNSKKSRFLLEWTRKEVYA